MCHPHKPTKYEKQRRAARDIEAQSRDFYLERAKHARDPTLRHLLELLAKDEDKHFRILNGLVEFLCEHAEWFEGCSALKEDALNFWVFVGGIFFIFFLSHLKTRTEIGFFYVFLQFAFGAVTWLHLIAQSPLVYIPFVAVFFIR